MFKKGLFAMLALSVMCCLTSCVTKESDDLDYADWEEPVVSNVIPGEMVLIPAGEFIMGSSSKANDDEDRKSVV